MKKNLKYILRRFKKVKKIERLFSNRFTAENLLINGKLIFKNFEAPKVSIVIPFYNQIDYTLNCLNHLHKCLSESKISFEIILIDDNSDEKYDFNEIENIAIIKNEVNLGFLKNCNLGINASKGEYIYLLNNDTEVQKGFLTELLYVFDNFSNVGAVGSMLINKNGSLQEAGSVFMNDFSMRQIVKKRQIFNPDVNYIRKVDYCSGCSLLFKKYKYNGEINLLDETLAPAYFEETDLCFDLKYKQGKVIYYTPFSKVIHFNGVSYNAIDKAKLDKKKTLFNKNAAIFKNKWQNELNNIKGVSIETRTKEIYDNKNIIFFSGIPQHDKDSGSNRFKEILCAYVKLGFHVSLISDQNYIDNSYIEFYQRLGIQVYYEHKKTKDFRFFIKNHIASADVCWYYGPNDFIGYYNEVKTIFSKTKHVYDMIDIHHLRFKRALELDLTDASDQRRFKKYLEIETKKIKVVDKIIAISDFDNEYMQQFIPKDKLLTISNIHYPKIEINETLPFESRENILFIGSTHTPNIDALGFLYKEIMPIVWQTKPNLKVNIIGNINELVNDIVHPNMIFHGFVPDITEFFKSNIMNVAPLRYGAGVKGKVGQSFEYYLPVVTTTIGAEGMKLKNNENALINDTVTGFANNILQLCNNKNVWLKLQANSKNSLEPFSKENLYEIISKNF